MMELSKRARAISAAGRELEKALGLERDVDTLSRWMAYRLAELRLAVEQASDPAERKAAQAEQDALIIALWAERSHLPGKVGGVHRLGPVIELLDALVTEQRPWSPRLADPGTPNQVVDRLTSGLQNMVASSAVLLYRRLLAEQGPEDPDLPLDAEERAIRDRLAKLSDMHLSTLTAKVGHWRTDPLPDLQIITLLEQAVGENIEQLTLLLANLRAMLLGHDEGSPKPEAKQRVARPKRKNAKEGRIG